MTVKELKNAPGAATILLKHRGTLRFPYAKEILDAMEEYLSLNLKAETEQDKEVPVAYEWHNHKTGHCYVDYIEQPHLGKESDGYVKKSLYYAQTDKTE